MAAIIELLRSVAPGMKVDPETVYGRCGRCGGLVRHKNGSHWIFQSTPMHFSCQQAKENEAFAPIRLLRSFFQVASLMHEFAPDLVHELEEEMRPLVRERSPDSFCRLVALILERIDTAELSELKRRPLNEALIQERAPYLR